jgi:anaerobic magnesium-protoporphyrin IX monomethyl ester cyclase
MKLMLVNTPIDQSAILGNFSTIHDDLKMIPTGLAYLASSARKHGIEVQILDQYAECLSFQEIENRIRSYSPDLIGYGSTTPNYSATITMIKLIKDKFPDIPVVMGGNHPSIFPDEALAYSEVDYVLRGEAEVSLPELCRALDRGHGLEVILGLSYRDKEAFIKHNPDVPPVNLDSLSWPAYDLLPMELYRCPISSKFAHPVYQMITSRGCPNKCSYCINSVEPKIGTLYRRRPIDDVVSEMEMLINKYQARQIQFWDPIFPLGKKHALEFCEKVIERGLHRKMVWNSTTYAELLDEEMIAAMVKAGCRGLGFGIESGVPELLRSVNRKSDLDKVRAICKIARRHGITVGGGFIMGFPTETQEMTRQTIDYAKSLDLHYAQFSIMVPYPGTPLYNQLKNNGELKPIDESEYHRINQSVGLTDNDLLYVPVGRNSAELKMWQKRAYREFYLRPKMVWMHLPHLKLNKIKQILKSFFAVFRL